MLTGAEQVFPMATDIGLEASLKQSDSSESCPSQIQHQHEDIDKITRTRVQPTRNERHQQSQPTCCDLQRLEKLQHLSTNTTVPTSELQKSRSDSNKDMMSKPQTKRGFNHPTSPKACRYFLPTTVQRFHDLTIFQS